MGRVMYWEGTVHPRSAGGKGYIHQRYSGHYKYPHSLSVKDHFGAQIADL